MIKINVIIYLVLVLVISGCDAIKGNKVSESPEAVNKTATKTSAIDKTYEATSVNMELIQVGPHSYYVKGSSGAATENEGFMSNAGVVITDEGVVVLDSLGTPSLAYLLYTKIREITDKPIVKVVVTHYHADHIYGLQVFKEMGAEIIAPAGAQDYLASPAAEGRLKERRESLFPWVNENTYIVKPDRYVSGKEQFTVGGIGFILTALGSTHSDGDLTMNVVQDKVLYAGDLIFEGRIPFVAGSKPGNWIDNLIALDASKLVTIVPGHGPASNKPVEATQATLAYLKFLHKHMSAAVDNMIPFAAAYDALDLGKYKKMPAAQVNRINAYSVYLGLEAASVGQ